MEFDGGGLHCFETPRKHLAQAVVNGKGTAVLNNDVAKLAKRAAFFESEHFQRHVTDEPCRHRPSEIGTVGLGHLVREGFRGDGGPKKGREATVEVGDGLDPLAGTDRRQRQGQATGRDDALTATKLPVCATGVEQRCGKHPWELVRDHAQLSVIHRGLLSWYPQPHTQEEFRIDHYKNPGKSPKAGQCGVGPVR